MGDFHLLQKSPSLIFGTYFSIIFQDKIFWILDFIWGGFWDPKLHFFRYFSPSCFGFIVGSILFRFFVDFGPLETLKIVLPPAREHNFYKIGVFHFIAKFDPKMTVLRVQNRCKIDENSIKKRISKHVFFLHRFFSNFDGFCLPS